MENKFNVQREWEILWKTYLVNINKSEAELARSVGQSQSNLNQKTKAGRIRICELMDILDKYGYKIKFVLKNER